MFFIGIFGVETKEDEIKEINNVICKSCGKISSYKLIKHYNFFHFFFIPVYKWNAKYFLISRCCDAIFEISSEAGLRLEREDNPIINDTELNEIKYGYDRYICPNCKAVLYEQYNYCPNCGMRLK